MRNMPHMWQHSPNVSFGELTDLHQLNDKALSLLVQAAYLHDLGHFIHDKKHHLHSYHSSCTTACSTTGSPETRQRVALIALNHRKQKELLLADLKKPLYDRLRSLIALLRMADVLDREHKQSTSIEAVHVDWQSRQITCTLAGIDLAPMEKKLQHKFRLAMEIWQMHVLLQTATEQLLLKN